MLYQSIRGTSHGEFNLGPNHFNLVGDINIREVSLREEKMSTLVDIINN